jgi:hypothetical protein
MEVDWFLKFYLILVVGTSTVWVDVSSCPVDSSLSFPMVTWEVFELWEVIARRRSNANRKLLVYARE